MSRILADIWRLYFDEERTLQAIADKRGVSRQPVHQILSQADGPLRTLRPPPVKVHCDAGEVKWLYLEEMFSIKQIGAKLQLSRCVVSSALNRMGITKRQRGIRTRYPEIAKLGIRESIIATKPTAKGKWYGQFYSRAKTVGIRVSVESIDQVTVRLT